MSRPGRFSLRVLAVTAVLFGLIAPASFGQAPSLTGEFLETTPGPGQQTTFGPFTCDKDGTTVIPFETQGAAFGPYFGTFTETGTVTIGPQTDTTLDSRGVGAVLDFQASFTINSTIPTGTVTGTKELAPTAPGASLSALARCDPDGSTEANSDVFALVSDPFILYDAQINATTGSRTDSGTGSFMLQSMPNLGSPDSFQEVFNSTDPLPPACDDDDDDDDDGQGHGKKEHHDDDDDCQGEDEDD